MKASAPKRVVAHGLILLLAALTLAGCATNRINWSERVGTYTYDQAVLEMGPPAKQATLGDGTLVAEWQTQRGYTQSHYVPYHGYGYHHRYYGPAFGPPVITQSPDVFLRLTFDANGKLMNWQRVML